MGNEWLVFVVIGWFALWFLFPIGIFLSIRNLDRNTDQLDRLVALRKRPEPGEFVSTTKVWQQRPFFGLHLKRGLRH